MRSCALPPFLLLLLLSVSCSDPSSCDGSCAETPRGNKVLLHGLSTCEVCISLAQSLERNRVEFAFLDVGEDSRAYQEMHDKLAKAYSGKQVQIPIVDVSGVLKDAPTVL